MRPKIFLKKINYRLENQPSRNKVIFVQNLAKGYADSAFAYPILLPKQFM